MTPLEFETAMTRHTAIAEWPPKPPVNQSLGRPVYDPSRVAGECNLQPGLPPYTSYAMGIIVRKGTSLERSPDVFIHIGLAKTATTTLQANYFPSVTGYLGKRITEVASEGHEKIQKPINSIQTAHDAVFNRLLAAYSRAPQALWKFDVHNWVRRVCQCTERVVLVSEECLTRWPSPRTLSLHPFDDDWEPNQRRRPAPIVELLSQIQSILPPESKFGVILVLRNQVDLMGSRYAESQRILRAPSQRDFEAKVRNYLNPIDSYFDYASLVGELRSCLGSQSLLVLLFEDGVESNWSDIQRFMGLETANLESRGAARNARRIGQRTWIGSNQPHRVANIAILRDIRNLLYRLWPRAASKIDKHAQKLFRMCDVVLHRIFYFEQREGVSITVGDLLAAEIRDAYRTSNTKLAQLINRDVRSMGY
jgi:hypothetical protein